MDKRIYNLEETIKSYLDDMSTYVYYIKIRWLEFIEGYVTLINNSFTNTSTIVPDTEVYNCRGP